MTKRKTRVYLASPYTVTGRIENHAKLATLEDRYELVTRALAHLTMKYHATHVFFGPITSSHPVSKHMPIEMNNYEFWLEGIDMEWLPVMDECWVLTDTDWEKSRGVASELRWFASHNLPIRFVDPVWFQVYDEPLAEFDEACRVVEGLDEVIRK